MKEGANSRTDATVHEGPLVMFNGIYRPWNNIFALRPDFKHPGLEFTPTPDFVAQSMKKLANIEAS